MNDINAFPWLFSKRKPVFFPSNKKVIPVPVMYADNSGNVYVDNLNNVYVDGIGEAQPTALTLLRYV